MTYIIFNLSYIYKTTVNMRKAGIFFKIYFVPMKYLILKKI